MELKNFWHLRRTRVTIHLDRLKNFVTLILLSDLLFISKLINDSKIATNKICSWLPNWHSLRFVMHFRLVNLSSLPKDHWARSWSEVSKWFIRVLTVITLRVITIITWRPSNHIENHRIHMGNRHENDCKTIYLLNRPQCHSYITQKKVNHRQRRLQIEVQRFLLKKNKTKVLLFA